MTIARKLASGFAFTLVFLWFLAGGIGHFAATEFFVSIVPPYVPSQLTVVYISGVLELAGAVALLFVRTRSAAAWGLFALTVAVTPANVYMWQHPELFPQVKPLVLSLRLAFQVFLLACIAWIGMRLRPRRQ